jgi:hypothetical protein
MQGFSVTLHNNLHVVLFVVSDVRVPATLGRCAGPIKTIYSMRKEPLSLRLAAHEIVLHLDTSSLIASDDDPRITKVFLSKLMLEAQPLLDSNFGAAADRARTAAGSRIDRDEWVRLQKAIREDEDEEFGEIEHSRPPVPVGYVYALRFRLDGLVIAEAEGIDRKAHLLFREAHTEVDLLWLPSIGPSAGPNVRIRVITHRDLSEHFDLIHATPIEGWSPPQGS